MADRPDRPVEASKPGSLHRSRLVVRVLLPMLVVAVLACALLALYSPITINKPVRRSLHGPEQPLSTSWLLLARADSRSLAKRAPHSGQQPASRAFKWSSAAILDDFALGVNAEDALDDTRQDNEREPPVAGRANNYDNESSREAAANGGASNAAAGGENGAAIKVQRVIDNISYSKTRADLRAARERAESAGSTPPTRSARSSTPPADPEAPTAAAETSLAPSRNVSLSGSVKHLPQASKTNETSNIGIVASSGGGGGGGSSKHSAVRRKRRIGSSAPNERGKPILNEFSFPANLVQGMRFVLMCQVLDGEPPIQIKWFKDNLDLGALLMQRADDSDNHQQQQQFPQTGFGPAAASRLMGLTAAIARGEAGNFSATGPVAGQHYHHLDHIEMVSNDELGSSLLFRKVKHQHGGNYTCLATNRLGSTSYTSLMTVKVPPTWRVEPQDRESIMGEQISIDCQAVGNPTPFLRWKFSGVQHDKILADFALNSSPQLSSTNDFQQATINQQQQQQQQQHLQSFKLINSNHHVQTLENGSLIIRQAGKEHEGLYLCEADNGVEPSLVKQIKLIVHKQAHFLDDIQVFLQPTAFEPASPLSPQPMGQHQDQLQQIGTKSAAQKDTTLSMQKQQQQQQQSNQLAQAIKVVSLPQNSSLVRLLCSPYGDIPIQLDWLKDGHLIYTHSSGMPNNNINDNNNSNNRLDTSATQSASSGSSGGSSASGDHASTMGRFHVSSRWNLPRSGNHPNGLNSELILSNLARHDAGLYTCTARNAFGQSDRKLRLIVQEPPEAPTMVDVVRIDSRSISLRWTVPSDGNSAITKYVIEYRKQPALSGLGSVSNQWHGDNTIPIRKSEKKMASVRGISDVEPMMDSPYVGGSSTNIRQPSAGSLIMGGGGGGGGAAESADRAQVEHTVHGLEPLTTYSLRVLAVNAIGQSRPSVALSLRTEEEVPATIPEQVEAIVLSSRSIKLRWTITYSLEHDLIDGFFIGYRSFDSNELIADGQNPSSGRAESRQAGSSLTGTSAANQAQLEQPTFIYKSIRLINQHQLSSPSSYPSEILRQDGGNSSLQAVTQLNIQQQQQQQQQQLQEVVLAPISSVTKSIPAGALSNMDGNKYSNQAKHDSQSVADSNSLVVISQFEFVMSNLERNTEYTILIQCYNKKGAGPPSDSVATKTLMQDPPEKLALAVSDLSETSLRLNWRFLSETSAAQVFVLQPARSAPQPPMNDFMLQSGTRPAVEPVDGFVLTYAKIAQPASSNQRGSSSNQWSRRHETPFALSSTQQQQQLQKLQQASPAARISNQSPSDNNFQYNPPLQPNQLLDHQWQAIQLAPQQREHILKNLECGTWYAMKMWAFNKVGKGEPSELATAGTRGKAPVPPSRSSFLLVNITQVKLNLNAWHDGGCEIEKFVVQYRARGQSEWILVSNNILREQGGVSIRDLAPATAYELLVGAQNHVGFSEAKYRFTSLDSDGKQVSSSKSFLPILNGVDGDDSDNGETTMIDYSDDQTGINANTRRESYASGEHLSGSGSGGGGARWLLVLRQVLNSPLTLLLTFSIFLVLLGLLLFNRFLSSGHRNGTSDHQNNHYHGASSSSSTSGGQLVSGKAALDCGASSIIRRCSFDGMTTILGEGEPAMSCATNGSSTSSADSPGRMLTAQSTMGRTFGHLNGSSAYNTHLDCAATGNNGDNSAVAANRNSGATYCGMNVGAYADTTTGLHRPDLSLGQTTIGGWAGGADSSNYGASGQQHAPSFYSAPPPVGSSYATAGPIINHQGAAPVSQPQSLNQDQSSIDRQQCLMQMLLISPHQQNPSLGSRREDYPGGATAAALTTLARHKAGYLKQCGDPCATSGSGLSYPAGPGNLTLGRLPASGQHSSFLAGEQHIPPPP